MKKSLLIFIFIPLVVISLGAPSQNAVADDAQPTLFGGLGENIQDSFTGTNLLFHAAGFASTALLVRSGYDAHVRDTFRESRHDEALPGAILGAGVGAVLSGGYLYYVGHSTGDRESLGGAFAVAQASGITLAYILLLKVTTGRAHPTNNWGLSSQEQSEQFQFGLFRNGLTAYGWPSGHVSNTVAVSSALAFYYPSKTWIKWLGLGLSSYMLYTVSAFDSGQMHWFSDGVAGAFMGYAIGSTVGKNLRHRLDGVTEKTSSLRWMPLVSSTQVGAMAIFDY